MRASQSQRAQPQPLPLPPPPLCLPSSPTAPRRGRHHRSSCSSSSSSSSSISSAGSTFCPSPSPSLSPRASTTSSLVPFSWERHPGVPKNSFRGGLALASSSTGTPLPLPPPLQPDHPRRRCRRAKDNTSSGESSSRDPFVAAFAECTRDDDGEDDEMDHGADDTVSAAGENKLWLGPAKKPTVSGRGERPWRHGAGGFLGFLDLYGCKSAMAVADGVFLARRPVGSSRPRAAGGRATIIRPR